MKLAITLENFYTVAENETKTDFLITFTKAKLSFTREDGVDKSNFSMEQLALKDNRKPQSYILTIGQESEELNLEKESDSEANKDNKIMSGFTKFQED